MADADAQLQRLAVVSELVGKAPSSFGRTALMKCLYFLQVLKDVPLDYDFRLYTYGPFDSDVLDDLRYAESLKAVESVIVFYPGGHGYELKSGLEAEKIQRLASDFLTEYQDQLDWVIRKFGSRSAVDLEMASTVVYIDRTLAKKDVRISTDGLAKMVHEVKPHLAIDVIKLEAENLKEEDLLKAAA